MNVLGMMDQMNLVSNPLANFPLRTLGKGLLENFQDMAHICGP